MTPKANELRLELLTSMEGRHVSRLEDLAREAISKLGKDYADTIMNAAKLADQMKLSEQDKAELLHAIPLKLDELERALKEGVRRAVVLDANKELSELTGCSMRVPNV